MLPPGAGVRYAYAASMPPPAAHRVKRYRSVPPIGVRPTRLRRLGSSVLEETGTWRGNLRWASLL